MAQTDYTTDNPSWLRQQFRIYRDLFVSQSLRLRGVQQLDVYGVSVQIDSPLIASRERSQLAREKYEISEINAIKKYLPDYRPVIELGASIGVIACFVNKRLQNPTQHIVIEPHPTIAALLIANRDRNQCQFKIVQAALAYTDTETIPLYLHESHTASSLQGSSTQSIAVATTTLQQILDEGQFQGVVLICDIEGMETDLVAHELHTLSTSVALIIIEVHERQLGAEKTQHMMTQLQDAGFTLRDHFSNVLVLENTGLTG